MGVSKQKTKREIFEKTIERKSQKVTKNIVMVVVSSLGPPEEGIVDKEANVTAFLNDKNVGKGTLHISEARVTWVGNDAGAHTFSLEYNHIALHAVSRDVTVFPNAECLYLMIDVKLVESAPPTPRSTPEGSDDSGDEINDGEGMTEVRFVPDDKSKLQEMFQAMSTCQALHPDPEDAENVEEEQNEEQEDEFDDDEEGMYEDADEPGEDGGEHE